MRMNLWTDHVVLFRLFFCILFFMTPAAVLSGGDKTIALLPPAMTSHEGWWLSQFGNSPQAWTEALGQDYQNRNSGPACVVMLINYKKGSRIQSDFGSFSDRRYPQLHSDVRWKFCGANEDKGYPGGFREDDQAEATAEELVDVLDHEDIPTTMFAGKNEVTIERIAEAVGRMSLVVCRVDPSAYFADEKIGTGRWVVVYGIDDESFYIHDPGRPEGKARRVARRAFMSAVGHADGGKNVVMLEALIWVGNYSDGWHTDGRSRMFTACYREFGEAIGFPYAHGGGIYVHSLGSCIVQDFQKPVAEPRSGNEGQSLLIFNPTAVKVFWVRGPIYEKYFSIGGFDKLGPPTVNEYPAESGRRQDFEKGSLVWNGKDVLVIKIN